ncbi:MAG: S8 family serine peptidase, partial [Proteobacteria bacterium]|nr:S8 family serine peptidase [Pseudomonadota bacterium]
IRILNLSFGASPASHYWDDPVNQAVMAVWKKGIIVVVAAGNGGPGPMTVGVPANVPYVITVGAMTDNYTPDDRSDDRLATFSAAGPTVEGFVKPELVAPGGHMLGQMPPYAWLPLDHPKYVQQVNHDFTMSGTSQAAAVVSGVLALMLEKEPSLKPDEAKCRVMASARRALRDDGTPAYSLFQQGAGLVDAVAAVKESVVDCANRGLNIKDDLAGDKHYAGPSGVDEKGTYYLVDRKGKRLSGPGFEWTQGSLWRNGTLWPEGSLWNDGALWNQGVAWNGKNSSITGSLWNQGSVWPEGSLWPEGAVWPEGLTRAISTSAWVDTE